MPCSDFEYSKFGRAGIGVNQPQSGLHYPFLFPPVSVKHLIADFYLSYEDTGQNYTHPLKLKWVYGLGCEEVAPPIGVPAPTHAVDVVVVDAADNVVFNSTTANFVSWPWGENNGVYDYHVYEWISATRVCRLVAYKTWPAPEDVGTDEDTARNYANHITPVNAVLDERAVYKLPKRVTAISVLNGVTPAGANASGVKLKNINLVYGYNTELTATPSQRRGLRATNQITIAAAPGIGAGKYSNCGDTPPFVYSINGLTGPDILLSADDCIAISVPTTASALNAKEIKITSDCLPCCQCNDYVQVANYMNITADRYRPIGTTADDIVKTHIENIDRWQKQQDCRLSQPLKLCLVPQRCAYMDVVAQYCNQCEQCAPNVRLIMLIETFEKIGDSPKTNTASIVCGRTNITTPYEPTTLERINLDDVAGFTHKKIATAFLGKIDRGNSGKVEFRLQFSDTTPTAVRVTLTAETKNNVDDPVGIPIKERCQTSVDASTANAITLAQLRCNDDGETDIPECNPLL